MTTTTATTTIKTIPFKISFEIEAYYDVEIDAPENISREELLEMIDLSVLRNNGEEYIPEDAVKGIARNKDECVSLITCDTEGEGDFDQAF